MNFGLLWHSPFAAQALHVFSLQLASTHALHPLNLRELVATRRRAVEHVVMETGRNELEPEVEKGEPREYGPGLTTCGDAKGMP